MKIVWASAAAALTLMTGAFEFSGPVADVDPVTVSGIGPVADTDQFFGLQVDGREGGCVLRTSAADGERRPLRLDPACGDIVPGLAGARWWLERADGSVAIVSDDGRVSAEFAVADGAAFESYAPRQPILTLLAR